MNGRCASGTGNAVGLPTAAEREVADLLGAYGPDSSALALGAGAARAGAWLEIDVCLTAEGDLS
jgi:hypothetical protein